MTNEISIQVAMSRADSVNTKNSHTFPAVLIQRDQTLKRHFDQVVSIGTTEENVTFGDISTNGFLIMYNIGANYVEWGTTTADYGGKMESGDSAGPFRLNAGKSLYMKANTAACDVRICMYGG